MRQKLNVFGTEVQFLIKGKTSMGNKSGYNVTILEHGREPWHCFKLLLTEQEAFEAAFDKWHAFREAQIKATELVSKIAPIDGKTFTVFYQKNFGEWPRDLYTDDDSCETPFRKADFVELATVKANDKEHLYHMMQGDFWSPEGEARVVIPALGLKHTSMSMGDLVQDPEGQYWVVAMIGFKKCFVY